MKIINMFRVGIPPPQLIFQEKLIIRINIERKQTTNQEIEVVVVGF